MFILSCGELVENIQIKISTKKDEIITGLEKDVTKLTKKK